MLATEDRSPQTLGTDPFCLRGTLREDFSSLSQPNLNKFLGTFQIVRRSIGPMLSTPARRRSKTVPRPLWRNPFSMMVVILAAGWLVASCGGGSTKTAAQTTPTSTSVPTSAAATASAARAKFTSCLESHGVPAKVATSFATARRGFRRPTAAGTAPGSSSATTGSTAAGAGPAAGGLFSQYSAAFSACRSLLPGGGRFAAPNNPQFAAYRNCLTAHGVSAPASTLPGSTTVPATTASSVLAAARAACAPLLPARSTTTTTLAG